MKSANFRTALNRTYAIEQRKPDDDGMVAKFIREIASLSQSNEAVQSVLQEKKLGV